MLDSNEGNSSPNVSADGTTHYGESVCTKEKITWKASGGHEYFFCAQGTIWANASTACGKLGSAWTLATITSKEENDFVVSNLAADTWIGLNDTLFEATFVWLTTEPVSYTNWFEGQPVTEFDTVAIVQGKWRTLSAKSLFHYVCESATPLCGNGVVGGTEQCDDGNAKDGDGCNKTCQNE